MKKVLVVVLLLTSACTTPAEIRQSTTNKMQTYGFVPRIGQTSRFKIYALEKITDPSLPTRVYIEGDGRAFMSNGMVSPDPTPESGFLLDLIKEDNYPNIVYLARPCQYGLDDPKCTEKYWTTGRFSEEVIQTYERVMLHPIFKQVELVGYSGGGAIAMALAEKNIHIVNIRTIAGNLDHNEFTKIHDVIPLSDSVSPKHMPNIPQIHFIGADDNIVPVQVAEKFKSQQDNTCSTYHIVESADHVSGWKGKWADLLKISPFCR